MLLLHALDVRSHLVDDLGQLPVLVLQLGDPLILGVFISLHLLGTRRRASRSELLVDLVDVNILEVLNQLIIILLESVLRLFARPVLLQSFHTSLVVQHQLLLLQLSDRLLELDVLVSHGGELLLEAVDLVPVLPGDLLEVAILLVVQLGHCLFVAALEDLVLGAQRLQLVGLLLETGLEVLDVLALVLEVLGLEVGLGTELSDLFVVVVDHVLVPLLACLVLSLVVEDLLLDL